jgi:hypothetical protein
MIRLSIFKCFERFYIFCSLETEKNGKTSKINILVKSIKVIFFIYYQIH